MSMRRIATILATAGVVGSGLLGATTLAAGEAAAGPQITCTGAICKNRGDVIGIGFGQYRCPNGIVYPSIAIVPPRGTAAVFPANCSPMPNLDY